MVGRREWQYRGSVDFVLRFEVGCGDGIVAAALLDGKASFGERV